MVTRQNDRGDVTEWTRLGRLGGVELTLVRELLQDEGIIFYEESLPAHDGALVSDVWVATAQHARAAALVAEAQIEAEAAAYREMAADAAERDRAAAAAASAADAAARAQTRAARALAQKAARKLAHLAKKPTARRRHEPSKGAPHYAFHSTAKRSAIVLGGALATLILVLMLIHVVGERYGAQAPVPGHHDESIACQHRYKGSCH
ncbi:MAG TPA: hypothetical protein VIA18_29570 [Polyangia bacterium]|jgi:hypothetical protein|nr:hypothetical protein [Polyangia bacterium]